MRYVIGALLLFPTIVSAAGFASESIFLSKSPVTEGDSVHIYAVVANPASSKFVGQMVVKEGDTKIGTTPVSLEAGGTQTTSVRWKPSAGSHTIVEELQSTDGTVVETKSKSFTILEKQKPLLPTKTPTGQSNLSSSSLASVESSQGIQDQINGLSPAAGSAVAPVFNSIDSLRGKIAGVADEQLTKAKSKMGGPSASSTNNASNPAAGAWGILWTLYFYLLTLLRFVIGNAGVFYPVVAVAFLFLLWKVFRRIRRPS